MFSKSKLEEILKNSPPKSTNPRIKLQEAWDEFLETLITRGYDKGQALELAKENAESLGLKMPKDSTFQIWWSTKRSKMKSASEKSMTEAPTPDSDTDSSCEPIPEKIRQLIREEMELDGWVQLGVGLTIFGKSGKGSEYQVWTGRNQPGSEPGKWVMQTFEEWDDSKKADSAPS